MVNLNIKIEDRSDVFGEIGNVFVERAVIDRKETNLVVLQRHELREVRCADFVQIFRRPVLPRAQEQLYLDEGEFRFDGQDHQKWDVSSPAPLTSAAAAKALISLAVTSG